MTSPTRGDDPPSAARAHGDAVRDRVRQRLAVAQRRLEGTWVDAFTKQLKTLHVFEWTSVFGAEVLWSVLPLLIVLSSLASTRIDDDLSRHIGLNNQGSHILEGLFRNTPSHAIVPIVTGLLIALAGTVAVVGSIQVLYERAFRLKQRGRRDLPRQIVWVAVLIAVLVGQAFITHPVRQAVGPVVQAFAKFVEATLFFWWTMHFLLAGRESWRVLLRPAVVTALLWLALALFSSLYFSSVVITDSKEYGTIGVMFTLLSWFILIGVVFVLGAACGAVWQQRSDRGVPESHRTRSQPER